MIDHWDNSIDQAESFTYDLTGNRTKLQRDVDGDSVVDEAITYRYDANDRLVDEILDDLTPTNADTTTTYQYDQTQQTEKTVTAGTTTVSRQTFGYNLQGRMSSVINDTFNGSGNLTARQRTRYEYDSKSYRIKLTNESDVVTNGVASGTWTTDSSVEFLADHRNHTGYAQTIRETKVENGHTLVTDYAFGHDEIAQRRHGTDQDGNAVDETHVFGHDGHGSVRVLYDLSGAVAEVLQAFTFAAYGTMVSVHDATGTFVPGGEVAALTSLGYSGEHFDAKAAQQYLRARFYNPANGRFNRLDPFAGNMQDPQSLHKYAYVHGDPVEGTDPSGKSMISVATAIALAANNFFAEFTTGALVIGVLEYAAKPGFEARMRGLLLIANGEIEGGFPLLNIGNFMISTVFGALELLDVPGLVVMGGALLLAAYALIKYGPDLVNQVTDAAQWIFRRADEADDTTRLRIPGDHDFIGPHARGWRLTPDGEGAHLVERVNVADRPALSQYDQADTPRFYPHGTPENAGAAHVRLHAATRDAGIRLRRGQNDHLSDAELITRYRQAYADQQLTGIRGDLRTPDSSTVVATDVTPDEAMEALMRWGGS